MRLNNNKIIKFKIKKIKFKKVDKLIFYKYFEKLKF